MDRRHNENRLTPPAGWSQDDNLAENGDSTVQRANVEDGKEDNDV
jgi:hypothetical protein